MTLLLVAVLAFAAGVTVGAMFVTRNAHRILARLSPPERIAFARKVNAAARDR